MAAAFMCLGLYDGVERRGNASHAARFASIDRVQVLKLRRQAAPHRLVEH
jgi:hypothetical protein